MARIGGRNSREIRSKMPRAMFDAYMEFKRAMWQDGTLGVRLQEMLRLRSAQLAQCRH